MNTKRFALYFSAAFTAMAVNIAIRIVLSKFMPFGASIVVSYFAGHIVNYLMSAMLVFAGSQNGDKASGESRQGNVSWRTFGRFTLVACGGLAVMFAVSVAARAVLFRMSLPFGKNLLELAAHICSIGCSFACNYVGHILYSFRASPRKSTTRRKGATDE